MANLSTLTVQIDGNSARLVKELKKANKKSSKFSKDVVKHGKNIAKAMTAVAAATAGAFAYETIKNTREFTKSISELSAITGATGKDLKFLSSEARRYGKETTQTATQAAQAFKLVASAKPDLLANAQALSLVTKETITLSEASGIELPEAAKALGEALNQFGAGADQASRFINVLAAGSQQGAVEIPELSEALVNAGVAAKQSGLDFENTVAALEALGKSGIKGSDAGTKLRSVLVKLQVQANDNFNPAVVGMSDALANLEKANLSVSEKVALFGERSISTIDALIAQRTEFDRLDEAIRGTSTAYEQQATNNNNLDGDLKKLGSTFEGLTLEVGTGFDDAMRSAVQTTTKFVNFLSENTDKLWDFADAAFGIKRSISSMSVEDVNEELQEVEAGILSLQETLQKAIERGANTTYLNEEIAELGQRYAELAEERSKLEQPIRPERSGGGEGVKEDEKLAPLELIDLDSLPEKLGTYESFTAERTRIALEAAQTQADGELAIAQALDAQKLEQQLLTDEQILVMAQELAAAKVMAEFEASQAAKGELGIPATYEEKLQLEKDIADESLKIAADTAAKRASIEADAAKKIAKYDFTTLKGKENTLKATLGLVAGFGKKNEKIQKAAFLAEKAITITKASMAIVGGTIQALNNPYPANLGFAAQVAAQGGALLGTLGSIGGGGGGGSFGGGSLSSPDFATNTAVEADEDIEQEQQATSVQVIIQGDVNGVDDYLETKMIPALEAAVNERDFVFIREGSRQAEEILA